MGERCEYQSRQGIDKWSLLRFRERSYMVTTVWLRLFFLVDEYWNDNLAAIRRDVFIGFIKAIPK